MFNLLFNSILLFYIMPMAWSLFYISIQNIEDRGRILQKKAFKKKKDLNACIITCFIPIFNIYVTYVSIKVTINSIFKS